MNFDRHAFGPAVTDLLPVDHLNELGPGRPNRAARERLASLTVETLFEGRRITDLYRAQCCLAGLWLYHDFLDESHRLSQEIETPDGSYWHGIMHRREPDYSNAKYWFRRVGKHPVFEPLQKEVEQLLKAKNTLDPAAHFLREQGDWRPSEFVDLCQAAASGRADCVQLCQEIQELEWQLLFTYCYAMATV